MKNTYLSLAIAGAVLPYIFFFQFIRAFGFDFSGFVAALFINGASSGFTIDLLFSSLLFWIWSYIDAKEKKVSGWWIVILLNLTIGLSCAMPFYFYLRESSRYDRI